MRRSADFRITLILVAVLALGAFLWWQQRQIRQERAAREAAELQAGLRASEVLSAAFELAPAVRVARLTGNVQSKGECKSGYFFSNEQRTVAPYAVNYFVDLKRLRRSDYRWDAASRTMFVEVPEPSIEQPSVDVARARSAQSGVYVSRTCGLAMQRQVAGRLQAAAREKAVQPEFRQKARDAARETVAGLTRRPLAAAGLRDVKVVVRFPSEAISNEQMDRSTPLNQVLAR